MMLYVSEVREETVQPRGPAGGQHKEVSLHHFHLYLLAVFKGGLALHSTARWFLWIAVLPSVFLPVI